MTLGSVIADGFNGAAFFGFFATGFFFGRGRLFINKRIAAVVVAFEIIRRGLAAQIAINALVVHVVFARDIFGIFICNVCHTNLNYDSIFQAGKPEVPELDVCVEKR
jgi:hypothetical protein